MHIVVNPDLKAYIDPLTPDEYQALERSLLSEGCRDALVLWGDTLVDGHNRHAICVKHGLAFNTLQSTQFKTLDDVHLWMIDQHLGRRSVSDFQRGVLALRKRAIVAERRAQAQAITSTGIADDTRDAATQQAAVAPWDDAPGQAGAATARPDALRTREDIAKAAKLSAAQVVLIEKIQKQASPELVAAVKSGAISISAAAAVASLPAEEQTAAALAGTDQLKLAAKRVRDAKRRPRELDGGATAAGAETGAETGSEVASLRAQVQTLQAENHGLRQQVAALQARLSDLDTAP